MAPARATRSPSRASRGNASSLVSLVALLAAACQVYDPSLVSRDAATTCVGRQPPRRPTTADGAHVDEVIYGLRDVVLNQEEGGLWADLGFNLDGLCTRPPEFPTECRPVQSGARPKPDGNDGVDNTFGSDLFPLVEAVVPGLEGTARAAQLAGSGLPVLRLRNWNGTPNDPRVHVTITQAVVTVPADADGSAPEINVVDYRAQLLDGTPAPAPVWDGDDYTWVRSDTFLASDPDQPLVYDDNAYVADNMIVVDLPDRIEILFPTDDVGVMVRLTGGIAVGRISADGTRLEDVIVGGRWSVIDLLRTAENIGVCFGSIEYNVLSARLDAIVDIRGETGSGGPEIECDAISLGVGFTGHRLQWGGVTAGQPLTSICDLPPDGGVPSQDAGLDAGVASDGGG